MHYSLIAFLYILLHYLCNFCIAFLMFFTSYLLLWLPPTSPLLSGSSLRLPSQNYRTYPLVIWVGATHKLKPSPTHYPLLTISVNFLWPPFQTLTPVLLWSQLLTVESDLFTQQLCLGQSKKSTLSSFSLRTTKSMHPASGYPAMISSHSRMVLICMVLSCSGDDALQPWDFSGDNPLTSCNKVFNLLPARTSWIVGMIRAACIGASWEVAVCRSLCGSMDGQRGCTSGCQGLKSGFHGGLNLFTSWWLSGFSYWHLCEWEYTLNKEDTHIGFNPGSDLLIGDGPMVAIFVNFAIGSLMQITFAKFSDQFAFKLLIFKGLLVIAHADGTFIHGKEVLQWFLSCVRTTCTCCLLLLQ